MVKLGSGFTKSEIKWISPGTTETAPEEICQETLLLIDVGECYELEGHTPIPGQAQPCLEFYSLRFCPSAHNPGISGLRALFC